MSSIFNPFKRKATSKVSSKLNRKVEPVISSDKQQISNLTEHLKPVQVANNYDLINNYYSAPSSTQNQTLHNQAVENQTIPINDNMTFDHIPDHSCFVLDARST